MTTYNFREIYEQKNTDELLDISRKELTEEARAMLNEVLSARGVSNNALEVAHEEANKKAAAQIVVMRSLASLWARIFAFSIDVWGVMFVLVAVLFPLRWISVNFYVNAVAILWCAYFFLRDSIPGQSIGKRTLGIRVVQLESGRSCNWKKSFLRNITHLIFLLDALFVLSQRNMRIGDMIAETIVVKST
ncbi:MAG TPA: RDD family protein [Gallionellaceae bacterium]